MLGIDDVDSVVESGQTLTEVTDLTDLDAAAKFDFLTWAKSKGLTKVGSKEIAEIPTIFLSQELAKVYAIPKA